MYQVLLSKYVLNEDDSLVKFDGIFEFSNDRILEKGWASFKVSLF